MPFPDSPRVIYKINPLLEVICQVRFPAILKIDSELPTAYQEALRNTHPIFVEGAAQQIKLDLSPELANVISGGKALSFRGRASYEFLTADRLWKIQLNRENLTLACARYERWEEFKEQFLIALNPFVKLYSPSFFTRIGLRYRDVIQRSKLGLETVPWRDLLEPHIAGELSSPDVADAIIQCVSQTTIELRDDRGQVLINHGLASNQDNEECYLIDSDFSTDQTTEVNDAIEKLDYYNQRAGRLFRWCISERLHNAMEPAELR